MKTNKLILVSLITFLLSLIPIAIIANKLIPVIAASTAPLPNTSDILANPIYATYPSLYSLNVFNPITDIMFLGAIAILLLLTSTVLGIVGLVKSNKNKEKGKLIAIPVVILSFLLTGITGYTLYTTFTLENNLGNAYIGTSEGITTPVEIINIFTASSVNDLEYSKGFFTASQQYIPGQGILSVEDYITSSNLKVPNPEFVKGYNSFISENNLTLRGVVAGENSKNVLTTPEEAGRPPVNELPAP